MRLDRRDDCEVEPELARVVRRQSGAISRRQLLGFKSAATIERWLADGQLVRLLPGVYRPAAVPLGTATKLQAAMLYAGSGAHLSHTTAARVHGIDANTGASIHVTVPASRTVQKQPGLEVYRSSVLAGAQVHETRARLRVTSAARTLVDLSDVLARPELDIAVADALRQNRVTVEYLRGQLLRSKRRRNVSALRAVLEDFDPALESVLEAEFALLLQCADLPRPAPQHEIWDGPLLVARVDFAYVGVRLAIEVDGYEFHSRYESFQRDRQRRRALKALRWDIVEFTARDIRSDASATVGAVQQLLARAA